MWQHPARAVGFSDGLRRRQLTVVPHSSFPWGPISVNDGKVAVRLPGPDRKAADWSEAEEYAHCVRRLAVLLRAGVPPVHAWDMLAKASGNPPGGHAGAEFGAVARRVSAAMKLGLEPDKPLRQASTASRDLWARLSWCVHLSKETGTPLATLFEHVAADETARADRGRALESVLAGPKTTKRLLSWLPAAGLVMAQLLGAQPVSLLLGSLWGHALLIAGSALWALNGWWGRRLLRKVTP